MNISVARARACAAAAIAIAAIAAVAGAPDAPEHQVEGLWAYHAITPKGRPSMTVDGLFVFLDGRFVQQSLNAGEPSDRTLALPGEPVFKVLP